MNRDTNNGKSQENIFNMRLRTQNDVLKNPHFFGGKEEERI